MKTDYEAIGTEVQALGIKLEEAGHSRDAIIDAMFVASLTAAYRSRGPRFVASYLTDMARRFEDEADMQDGGVMH